MLDMYVSEIHGSYLLYHKDGVICAKCKGTKMLITNDSIVDFDWLKYNTCFTSYLKKTSA